jgi:hypothetical protein
MRIPKIVKPFLRLTSDEKTPTDMRLDNDIEYVSMLFHHAWPVFAAIVRRKIRRFFRYRWKFVVGQSILWSAVLVLAYYAFVKVFNVTIIHAPAEARVDTCASYDAGPHMNLRNFMLQVAYTESRYNKHAKRDSSQYWGLYQIGREERRVAGYGDMPMAVYLNHPEIQDLCMIELLKYNKKQMRHVIDKYSGRIVDGILVTESGVLALCHVAGCGGASQYLSSGIIPERDANGNPIRSFLKLGGYDLRLENVKYSIQDAVTGSRTIK